MIKTTERRFARAAPGGFLLLFNALRFETAAGK
jgi:hypothetical protein